MIGIVNYGVGNLFSISSALERLKLDWVISDKPEELSCADRLILPGVGAFADAAKRLKESGLGETVLSFAQSGKPLLGICLGMQLLYEKSHEYGLHTGLGLIPGEILSLKEALNKKGADYKVPHMGWNELKLDKPESALLKNLGSGEYVYFVHSFFAPPSSFTGASCSYGVDISAECERDNVFGVQFHPEKSGRIGLQILQAFSEISL